MVAFVNVTNTGSVAGKEAVQLYVSAPAGNLDKPVKELKAYAKSKELSPGEAQTLSFSIPLYELASFDESQSAWVMDAGTYNFLFGASSRDIRCTATASMDSTKSWPVHNVLAPQE